ncbi:MAG: N-acetylglucosamine-6-phosphate deacetylase [Clostridia bacterium]|nr:N-acetylglucosamine-6-phosphate deacetylase [Clostridia bacterium]
MILKISNGIVVSGGKLHKNKSVYIKDNKILAVTEKQMPHDRDIDAGGYYVSAGFIDIHVHGGGGFDFTDGGARPILAAASFHSEHGTTTVLPTMPAAEPMQIEQFLYDVQTAMTENDANVNIYGAHLEGPYLSKEQCGALDISYMRSPNEAEYKKIAKDYSGVLKRWTFAPELSGSSEFYNYIKNNIVGSVGHSNAVFDDVKSVYDDGCRLITHLYSAMSTITRKQGFRQLGVVESAFLLDEMAVEIIADLRHLPAELIKLIYRIKGVDNICLITDAMRGAGMPDGQSVLGNIKNGLPCIIEDGVAKLVDRSAFAGSVATADMLVRNCVKKLGIDIASAVKMITINPARAMGIKNKGDIKEGMDADIVLFDSNINIKKVIVMGRIKAY